jgi:hypothetical protein
MALSHKQKGPVPDAALQARIAKLEAALHRITHEAKIRKALHAHDALDFAIIANDALKEPVSSLREAGLAKPNCPNLEEPT